MPEKIHPGAYNDFTISSLSSDGMQRDYFEHALLTDKKGGGFYGNVYFTEGGLQNEMGEPLDYVVKTTETGPFHTFLRDLHWKESFPSNSNLFAAQLDHLSMRMLHRIIPFAMGGTVVTPDSYGYGLTGNGYVQFIEKMKGRIPHLGEESHRLQDIRKKLFNVCVEIGAEHGGQIHPDNPRGKPNLWVDPNDPLNAPIIWLDLTPAIQHKGRALWFKFPFHHDMKERFGGEDITYNRFHTDRLRAYVAEHAYEWEPEAMSEVLGYADVYDQVWEQYVESRRAKTEQEKDSFLQFALEQQILTEEQASVFRESSRAYKNWVSKVFLKDLAVMAKELPKKLSTGEFLTRDNFAKIFSGKMPLTGLPWFNVNYMKRQLLIHYPMRGYKKAFDEGLLSQADWDKAIMDIEAKNINHLLAIQFFYIAESWLCNAWVAELALKLPTAEHKALHLAYMAAIDRVMPTILRGTTTATISKLTGEDLRRAFIASLTPIFGSYIPIPAQLSAESEEMWYLTRRMMVSYYSKVRHPVGGGYGGDREEELMEYFTQLATRVNDWRLNRIEDLQSLNISHGPEEDVL